jgi:hypothetical protein
MANVVYWSGSWTSSGDDDDLYPGESHYWIAWGYNYGDAITITAHPVQGNDEHILAVENVRIQADAGGRRIFYSVRNAGAAQVPGYAVGYAQVSE